MSNDKSMSKIQYFGIACATFALSLVMRFLHFSSRKKYTNEHEIKTLFENNQNFIMSVWHNRLLLQYFGYRKFNKKRHPLTALISKSTDGTIAQLTLSFFGIKAIRGSSSRGGTEALRDMRRAAKSGTNLTLTPDGPKGPVYEVKGGVLAAAKLTGLPILPATWFARDHKRMKSWDRFIVARPFTVVHYVFGTPIYVPRKCSDEEFECLRLQLEAEMMRINAISKNME